MGVEVEDSKRYCDCVLLSITKKKRKRKRIRNEAYGQSSNEWRRWAWAETPYDKWTNSEERIKKWKRQDMPLGAGLQDRSSSHCMPTNIPAKFSMLPIITLLCVVQYNSWPVYGGFFFYTSLLMLNTLKCIQFYSSLCRSCICFVVLWCCCLRGCLKSVSERGQEKDTVINHLKIEKILIYDVGYP